MMLIKDFKQAHGLTDQQFQRAAKQAESEGYTVRQDRRVLDGSAILSRVKRRTVLDGSKTVETEIMPTVSIVPMALEPEVYELALSDFGFSTPSYSFERGDSLATQAIAYRQELEAAELEAIKTAAIQRGQMIAHMQHQFENGARTATLQQLKTGQDLGKS
jgi:hypothetical protein